MSDFLTDEEQLEKFRNWWVENGVAVIVAVIVAIAGVVGWRWYDQHRTESIARASDLYADYLEASGTEQETIESTLASEFPDSTYRGLVLMRDAKALADGEDAEGALEKLEQALAIISDERLSDLVRLRSARLQQQLDRTDAAFETLKSIRSMGYRSQVLELKGDIHMTRGERALAHEAYRAALHEVGEGTRRPLLEMKAADTADTADADDA